MATLANILSYADTLLLTDVPIVEALKAGIPVLMDALRQSQQRPQRFYAAAGIANASSHPRLASVLTQNGGEIMAVNFLILAFAVNFSPWI